MNISKKYTSTIQKFYQFDVTRVSDLVSESSQTSSGASTGAQTDQAQADTVSSNSKSGTTAAIAGGAAGAGILLIVIAAIAVYILLKKRRYKEEPHSQLSENDDLGLGAHRAARGSRKRV